MAPSRFTKIQQCFISSSSINNLYPLTKIQQCFLSSSFSINNHRPRFVLTMSRNTYVFPPPWNQGCEDFLFYYIAEETSSGHWIKGNLKNNVDYLESIHRQIHSSPLPRVLRHFCLEDFVTRFGQWHSLFHIFSFIITHHHVDYRHRLSNPAPRAMCLIWSELLEVCPEFMYFKEAGEANWPILQSMFRAPTSPNCGRSSVLSLRVALSYVDPALLACSDTESVCFGSNVSSYPSLE